MKDERNVNAYSPDGRIYQLEYAMKAVSLGTTTIGMCVADSVVVASERKLVSALQDPRSVRKHHKVYDHCSLAFSGLSGDARTIVRKAREFCTEHEFAYNEKKPIEGVLRSLSAIALNFGEKDQRRKIFSRPFGISALVCGYDTAPKLFFIDPSGTYIECRAKSIGSAAEAVGEELKAKYNPGDTLEGGARTALLLLKAVMKDAITAHNCELMACTKDGVRFFAPEEIAPLLA